MAERLEILPVSGIGDIAAGTDVARVIATAAPWLRDGDVLVVTSKIVSKAEGRLADVPVGGPEREAAREALVTAESAHPVARRGGTRIVRTHHGFVMASAGIDASNVERTRLVLLPKDPDASARALRAGLADLLGVDVAVIVSDTMGRPWRTGLTDVALGVAGLVPIRDYRGETDPYGNELLITQVAVADELSSAAELVKGKCDQVPVAVVRGHLPAGRPVGPDGPGAVVMIRDPDHDLFPLGSAEARAGGLHEAATLGDAVAFGDGTVDAAAVARAVAAAAPASGLTVSDPAGYPVPPGTSVVVAFPVVTDPAAAVNLGMQVHRVRCALAALGLDTAWRPTATGGVLAVGGPALAR